MLTYSYKCTNPECDIHNMMFEKKQKISDKPYTNCKTCEQETLIRVITPSGGFRIGGLGVNKPTAHWGG